MAEWPLDLTTVGYDEDGGMAIVTLNRPDALNAFNATMRNELAALWSALRTRDEVRVIVLTGAGNRAFCTGIDRTEAMADLDPDTDALSGYASKFMFDDPASVICPKSHGLWKPIIAAVNGMACGGAFYLLGESDIIIATESATFFDPHVTYGMTAAFEPIHLLRKLPFHELVRMSLLGANERLSAQRAFDVGFVSEVVPPDALLERARWVANAIAEQPTTAIQGTLRALWMGLELTRQQALDQAYLFTALGTDNASLAEGQARFESKARVEWRLR
jgi:enoyl-CoA hydratase/carnithine racemase